MYFIILFLLLLFILYFSGLRVESIYRVSASLGDINKLKEEFNKGIMSCDIIDLSCDIIDLSCDVINVSWTSSICHVTSLLFFCVMFCVWLLGLLFMSCDWLCDIITCMIMWSVGVTGIHVRNSHWSGVHVFSGAFKLYLRDLPEPVFTYHYVLWLC